MGCFKSTPKIQNNNSVVSEVSEETHCKYCKRDHYLDKKNKICIVCYVDKKNPNHRGSILIQKYN